MKRCASVFLYLQYLYLPAAKQKTLKRERVSVCERERKRDGGERHW
jgi:hypothetical protein